MAAAIVIMYHFITRGGIINGDRPIIHLDWRAHALRQKLKTGDWIVFIFILLSAISIFLAFKQEDTGIKTAVIIKDGVVIDRIRLDKLDKPMLFPYEGKYPGVIEAEPGRIRFKEAQCPDKVCVHTGWLSHVGQIAVCLPQKMMIRIEGTPSDDDIDIYLH